MPGSRQILNRPLRGGPTPSNHRPTWPTVCSGSGARMTGHGGTVRLPYCPALASACGPCPWTGWRKRMRATRPVRLRRCPARPKPRGQPERSRAAGAGWPPAPEDHAFSDTLRQAARERDVPLATFTDPGVVAPADRELAHALVLVERASGRSIQRAKLAVRQLLAERDRVLREPVVMRLPPIAPERLAGMIRSLAATLEQDRAATPDALPIAVPSAPTEPAHLSAAGLA